MSEDIINVEEENIEDVVPVEEETVVVNIGGTSNYNELRNKPKINDVELNGNKTSSDLGLATSAQGGKADTAVQQTTTIAGIDLQDNITKNELLDALNVADGASRVYYMTSNPTTSSVGKVNDLWINVGTSPYKGSVYYCSAVTPQGTTPETYTYTWTFINQLLTTSEYRGLALQSGGMVVIAKPTDSQIDNRNNNSDLSNTTAVVLDKFDYAVKKSITTNEETLTETEKDNAQSWLGLNTLTGSSAPTTSTAGMVGQFYINTSTGIAYQCVAVTPQGTTPETYTYTWEELINASKNQTISGQKTFTNGVTFTNRGRSGTIYNSGDAYNLVIRADNDNASFRCARIIPFGNNTADIGSSSYKWKDLYLNGNLSDGTNSIAISKIANKDNFVTLTQADYDALVQAGTVDANTYYYIVEE